MKSLIVLPESKIIASPTATDLLNESLQKMSIYHGDFRTDASKVLAAMLESRLRKKYTDETLPTGSKFDDTDNVMIRNKINDENHVESRERHSKIFLTNQPEVSTHACDRRSYIGQITKANNQLTLSDKNPEINDPICEKCKLKINR